MYSKLTLSKWGNAVENKVTQEKGLKKGRRREKRARCCEGMGWQIYELNMAKKNRTRSYIKKTTHGQEGKGPVYPNWEVKSERARPTGMGGQLRGIIDRVAKKRYHSAAT